MTDARPATPTIDADALRGAERVRRLTESRTTATDVVRLSGRLIVRKTWTYPTWRDRLRGAFRTTFLARSPARREFEAMQGGGPTGFHPPSLAVHETRVLGFLVRADLAVELVPEARDLAVFLCEEQDASVRRIVLHDLASRVAAMHASGVVDGEMHARNVLVAAGAGTEARTPLRTWKVDCPKQRTHGSLPDAGRIADLASLDVALARFAARPERCRALARYLAALNETGNPWIAPGDRDAHRRAARDIEAARRTLAPREEQRLPSRLRQA